MNIFQTVEALAADLAGAGVDPNEAQKALAYLRSKRDSQAFFAYLQAVATNGSAVIRSGRTLGYYRDLLAICRRHLKPIQDDYAQMLATFAWSLRLLRYYRAVPQELQDRPETSPAAAKMARAEPAAAPIPEVGQEFTGQILDADESAVLIEVPGFAAEEVTGVIKAEHRGKRSYRVGNAARVTVLAVRKLKSGRTIVELQPASKKK
jgi:hypothetical protein